MEGLVEKGRAEINQLDNLLLRLEGLIVNEGPKNIIKGLIGEKSVQDL